MNQWLHCISSIQYLNPFPMRTPDSVFVTSVFAFSNLNPHSVLRTLFQCLPIPFRLSNVIAYFEMSLFLEPIRDFAYSVFKLFRTRTIPKSSIPVFAYSVTSPIFYNFKARTALCVEQASCPMSRTVKNVKKLSIFRSSIQIGFSRSDSKYRIRRDWKLRSHSARSDLARSDLARSHSADGIRRDVSASSDSAQIRQISFGEIGFGEDRDPNELEPILPSELIHFHLWALERVFGSR